MASALVDAYTKLLKKLFPLGRAWDSVREDVINLFPGMAVEFCRVDDRGRDLLIEIDPGTSTELLPDWLQLLGIPDDCTPLGASQSEQRQQARQKLAAVGGISKAFYENLGASLGFEVFIRDYLSFRVGSRRVGDPLSNPYRPDRDQFRVGAKRVSTQNDPSLGRAGDSLRRHGWRFTFEANFEATVVAPFRVGENRVGDPLIGFGNPLLECTYIKYKPAHTSVFFTFR